MEEEVILFLRTLITQIYLTHRFTWLLPEISDDHVDKLQGILGIFLPGPRLL